jgi:hypothetical protein
MPVAVLSAGGDPASKLALFQRENRPGTRACVVGWGAAHTVDETMRRFRKWEKSNRTSVTKEARRVSP